MDSPITVAGLALDIAGAALLASAFILKQPKEMLREASTYLGWNSALYVSLARQKADAQIGFALLALGFLLQADGAVGWNPGWATEALVLLLAGLAIAAALLCRPLWTRRLLRDALVELLRDYWQGECQEQRDMPPVDYWTRVLDGWASELNCEPKAALETYGEYGQRLLGRKRWAELDRLVGGCP
jgi:hypothetical protein